MSALLDRYEQYNSYLEPVLIETFRELNKQSLKQILFVADDEIRTWIKERLIKDPDLLRQFAEDNGLEIDEDDYEGIIDIEWEDFQDSEAIKWIFENATPDIKERFNKYFGTNLEYHHAGFEKYFKIIYKI